MSHRKTKDPVNETLLEVEATWGIEQLGLMTNQVWIDDPKRLVFTLARYKFVAKMLTGTDRVLEVGCGDGFASRIVRQEVRSLTISDYDPLFVERFKERSSARWPTDARVLDLLEGPTEDKFDAAYTLDVLEHIPADLEERFLGNLCASLTKDGVAIIGMPSLESQAYASPASKAGHVNCKSGPQLRETLLRHFRHVFLFSMNDEVVHTGYHAMAHYLIGLCIGPVRAAEEGQAAS
jgi:2-polyprenyl-3-methyl-5-hydroxy-6-metoxy-1,4-benzoquinol methylase